MEMKLNKEKLKELRVSQAWSQSHLAEVSGVSLRTIQRIEKSGIASPESVKSICATFAVQINELTEFGDTKEGFESSISSIYRRNITKQAIKATIIAFVIAFIFGFFLTQIDG